MSCSRVEIKRCRPVCAPVFSCKEKKRSCRPRRHRHDDTNTDPEDPETGHGGVIRVSVSLTPNRGRPATEVSGKVVDSGQVIARGYLVVVTSNNGGTTMRIRIAEFDLGRFSFRVPDDGSTALKVSVEGTDAFADFRIT